MKIKALLPVCALLAFGKPAFGETSVRLSEFGIVPNTGENIAPALEKLIKGLKGPARLEFEAGGEYLLRPQKGRTAVTVEGKDSLSLVGNGCLFLCEGNMLLFRFSKCNNLDISGISIDFKEPLACTGEIVGQGEGYLDLRFDKVPAAEIDPESYSTLHLPQSPDIVQGSKDKYLSPDNSLFRSRPEQLDSNTIRYWGKCRPNAPKGCRINLYYGRYMGGLFQLEHCNKVKFSKMNFYHSGGMGIRARYCRDIDIDSLQVRPSGGRTFSILADALHFNLCAGDINLSNSYFDGQGDDALNVHGRYFRSSNISRNKRKITLLRQDEILDFPQRGDSLWIIKPGSMEKCGIVKVADSWRGVSKAAVVFEDPLPEYVTEDYFLENASWCANLKVSGCHFGKGNRARGILFTTPGKVEICGNYFRSAGSAILIEGDTSYWFESGAVENVDIHDNYFDCCGTSCKDFEDGWGWGLAPICISPSAERGEGEGEGGDGRGGRDGGDGGNGGNEDGAGSESEGGSMVKGCVRAYHRNIRIHDNRFRLFDEAIVSAKNVDGLLFENNTIEHCSDYRPILFQRKAFDLKECSRVEIRE